MNIKEMLKNCISIMDDMTQDEFKVKKSEVGIIDSDYNNEAYYNNEFIIDLPRKDVLINMTENYEYWVLEDTRKLNFKVELDSNIRRYIENQTSKADRYLYINPFTTDMGEDYISNFELEERNIGVA